ncbi:MAG TPA: sialidase family protein, partial [Chloroflexota bacterium]|nr:sialidase family protein [Chloroflexota bacterium]
MNDTTPAPATRQSRRRILWLPAVSLCLSLLLSTLAVAGAPAHPDALAAVRQAAPTCPDSVHPNYVTALANGPGGELLAGTGDGLLARSTDRGGCWSAIAGLPKGIQIGTLLAVPGHTGWLIAGGSFLISTKAGSFVLYRSEDNGQTWTAATSGLSRGP